MTGDWKEPHSGLLKTSITMSLFLCISLLLHFFNERMPHPQMNKRKMSVATCTVVLIIVLLFLYGYRKRAQCDSHPLNIRGIPPEFEPICPYGAKFNRNSTACECTFLLFLFPVTDPLTRCMCTTVKGPHIYR